MRLSINDVDKNYVLLPLRRNDWNLGLLGVHSLVDNQVVTTDTQYGDQHELVSKQDQKMQHMFSMLQKHQVLLPPSGAKQRCERQRFPGGEFTNLFGDQEMVLQGLLLAFNKESVEWSEYEVNEFWMKLTTVLKTEPPKSPDKAQNYCHQEPYRMDWSLPSTNKISSPISW